MPFQVDTKSTIFDASAVPARIEKGPVTIFDASAVPARIEKGPRAFGEANFRTTTLHGPVQFGVAAVDMLQAVPKLTCHGGPHVQIFEIIDN